jgi:hypothetical protein
MAASDYRLCDVCSRKAFYDSNLNYDHENDSALGLRNAGALISGLSLDNLGDWAVICVDCAKTHKCVIVSREQDSTTPDTARAR